MVFGIKRKRVNTSDTWREEGAVPTERKAFKEDNVKQDKIFDTWKEDKNSQSNDSGDSGTWEEDK